MSQLEPAFSIVRALGGASAVARLVDVHRSAVYLWMRGKEVNGTGGTIPQRHIGVLLKEAQRRGLDLTLHDFLGIEAAQ